MDGILNTTLIKTEKPKFWEKDELACLTLISGLLLGYFLIALLFSALIPDNSMSTFATINVYIKKASVNCQPALMLIIIFAIIAQMRKSGNTSFFLSVANSVRNTPEHIVKFFALAAFSVFSFGVFVFSYSTIKTRIPDMVPYVWDEAFMKMDRFLFFGNDPWTLFSWIYKYPDFIHFIDRTYDVWAALFIGIWAFSFLAKSVPATTRFRIPLTLILTWFIGGNIIATLLSSAGPCYYGFLSTGPNPYLAQLAIMADLNEIRPLSAVTYQELLWSVYQSPSVGFGGISAMPSMHCATSFLFVLMSWKHKFLRPLAIAFFGFIFISSIMLAWHYAVDGILAVPITLFSWWLAGKMLTFKKVG